MEKTNNNKQPIIVNDIYPIINRIHEAFSKDFVAEPFQGSESIKQILSTQCEVNFSKDNEGIE